MGGQKKSLSLSKVSSTSRKLPGVKAAASDPIQRTPLPSSSCLLRKHHPANLKHGAEMSLSQVPWTCTEQTCGNWSQGSPRASGCRAKQPRCSDHRLGLPNRAFLSRVFHSSSMFLFFIIRIKILTQKRSRDAVWW